MIRQINVKWVGCRLHSSAYFWSRWRMVSVCADELCVCLRSVHSGVILTVVEGYFWLMEGCFLNSRDYGDLYLIGRSNLRKYSYKTCEVELSG